MEKETREDSDRRGDAPSATAAPLVESPEDLDGVVAGSTSPMVPDIASVCRLHHSESFGGGSGSGDKDVLALYEVQPRDMDDLALFKDEPLYKVHRHTQSGSVGSYPVTTSFTHNEDLNNNTNNRHLSISNGDRSGNSYSDNQDQDQDQDHSCGEGEGEEGEDALEEVKSPRPKGLRRAVSDDVIRTYYVGAATSAADLFSNSCDEHLSGAFHARVLQSDDRTRRRQRRRKKRTKSIDHYPFVLGHESETWTFNDNLIWTICEFLPQEEVFYNLVFVAKSWRHALRNFPLILDQGAVKSFLGMRAIRISMHTNVLARILRQWSIGFLCLRLKSRDTLESLVTRFPSLTVSLWGLVLKTKNTARWSSEGEVAALSLLKNLQVLDIRCCEGLESLSQVLRHNVYSLRRIDLSSCTHLTDVSILACCTYLESLCLDHCEALTKIPDLDGKYLQSFLLGQCEKLESLPKLEDSTSLQRLHLGDCSSMINNDSLESWNDLHDVSIARCDLFTDLSCFASYWNLSTLELAYCKQLKKVSGLKYCVNLEYVSFEYCTKLRDISALRYCCKLKSLGLNYCKQLRDISPLVGCRSQGCARTHTVDLHELSYFASIERAHGIEPREVRTVNSAGWRKWSSRKRIFRPKPWDWSETAPSGLLLHIPGVAEGIPSLVDRLEELNFIEDVPVECNAAADSLESVEIRRCRKVKNVESLVACMNLRRLCVHGCDNFPKVELEGTDACEQYLRRQINLSWSRFTS